MDPQKQEHATRRIQTILNNPELTPEQLRVLRKLDEANAAEGLTLQSRESQLEALLHLAQFLRGKRFERVSVEDVRSFLASEADKGLSRSTLAFRSIIIRKLMKFLGRMDVYEAIKPLKADRKLPEVLTEEEVKRMIEVAKNDRDKALIHVMYESGCRLGELVGLRVRDVQFDQYGAKLLVRGKTGDRPVRLIHSAPTLQHWLEHHRFKDNPSAPLFYSNRGRPLTTPVIQWIVRTVAREAGIEKRVYPHLLRHSRFTHLSRQLTDTELMVLAGWKTRSMCDVYNHLSMRDVEDKLLKIHGVLPEERPQESPLAPRRCPRCQETNPATNRFCSKCGLALDAKVATRLEEETRKRDERLARVLEDPEVRALLIRKLAELD